MCSWCHFRKRWQPRTSEIFSAHSVGCSFCSMHNYAPMPPLSSTRWCTCVLDKLYKCTHYHGWKRTGKRRYGHLAPVYSIAGGFINVYTVHMLCLSSAWVTVFPWWSEWNAFLPLPLPPPILRPPLLPKWACTWPSGSKENARARYHSLYTSRYCSTYTLKSMSKNCLSGSR